MNLYSEGNNYKLYHGSMLDMLEVIPKESIGSIVTDPPYGLTSTVKRFGKENAAPHREDKNAQFARLTKGFMGKEWDGSGIEYNLDTWRNCYEVLKPGGYLLAFGGSRTFHRIACAIEDAGFEIRDTIMWLYGSGFPKSMNIGLALDKKNGVESKIVGYADTTMPDFRDVGAKQKEISGIDKLTFGQIENSERKAQPIYEAQNEWAGWGTALKPAYEPIIVARKPFKGTLVDNVEKNGVGGINIDECRVDSEIIKVSGARKNVVSGDTRTGAALGYNAPREALNTTHTGRFPANVILTYDQITFDEVCGGMPNTKSRASGYNFEFSNQENPTHLYTNIKSGKHFDDSGSACRYFYCAKASTKDRDEGLTEFKETRITDGSVRANAETGRKYGANPVSKKNTHPTVKPTELMQYLVRLVTPKGETILDPFNGSGSTGKAVMYENAERGADYKYIGIELTEEYLPIAKARIEYVERSTK